MNITKFVSIILIAAVLTTIGGFVYYRISIYNLDNYFDATYDRTGGYNKYELLETQTSASIGIGQAKTIMLAGGILSFICFAAIFSMKPNNKPEDKLNNETDRP